MIAEAVAAERSKAAGEVVGIAGGANGGDILFHEVCAEQGIKTQLFIVGSRDAYVRESVQDGGPQWVERFDRLHAALPVRVLGNSQVYLQAEANAVWGTPRHLGGVTAADAAGAVVTALSCGAPGNCSVGGLYRIKTYEEPFLDTQKDGTWGKARPLRGISP